MSLDASLRVGASVPTGAQSPGGNGSGTVESVTGAAPGIVDNTDPANPVVQAQFGADTTVKLPNSGAALVDALHLIASLTNNAPGSEASKWLIRLLSGGVQGDALSIEPNALGVGDRLYFLNDAGQDTYLQRTENTISFFCAGVFVAAVNTGGLLLNPSIGAQLIWAGTTAGLYYNSATGRISVHSAGTVGNVQLGEDAVMDTAATGGFPTIPQMAGPPTGVPANVPAGQVPMVISNPGDSASKLWFFLNGVWVSTTLS